MPENLPNDPLSSPWLLAFSSPPAEVGAIGVQARGRRRSRIAGHDVVRAISRTAGAIAVAALLPLTTAADAEERIEGIVRDTVVTHCDATRRGGCAGRLTLEHCAGGQQSNLIINVPLGTPISHGPDRVLLQALKGQAVIVTQTYDEEGGRVALAVQVVERPDSETAAGSL